MTLPTILAKTIGTTLFLSGVDGVGKLGIYDYSLATPGPIGYIGNHNSDNQMTISGNGTNRVVLDAGTVDVVGEVDPAIPAETSATIRLLGNHNNKIDFHGANILNNDANLLHITSNGLWINSGSASISIIASGGIRFYQSGGTIFDGSFIGNATEWIMASDKKIVLDSKVNEVHIAAGNTFILDDERMLINNNGRGITMVGDHGFIEHRDSDAANTRRYYIGTSSPNVSTLTIKNETDGGGITVGTSYHSTGTFRVETNSSYFEKILNPATTSGAVPEDHIQYIMGTTRYYSDKLQLGAIGSGGNTGIDGGNDSVMYLNATNSLYCSIGGGSGPMTIASQSVTLTGNLLVDGTGNFYKTAHFRAVSIPLAIFGYSNFYSPGGNYTGQMGASAADDGVLYFNSATGGSMYVNIGGSGRMTVHGHMTITGTLSVHGNTTASGQTSSISDINTVSDVQPMPDSYTVSGMQPVVYTDDDQTSQIGIIASQMQDEYAELVTEVDVGEGVMRKALNYTRIIPILINDLKKLMAKNEELEERVALLEQPQQVPV